MTPKQSKVDCTFELPDWKAEGLADVIEIHYSDRIRFCNFVMQITDDQLDNAPDTSPLAKASLTLEDGRKATVSVTHFGFFEDYFELAGAGSFNSE